MLLMLYMRAPTISNRHGDAQFLVQLTREYKYDAMPNLKDSNSKLKAAKLCQKKIRFWNL